MNWNEALASLVTSRIDLIRAEMRDFSAARGRKAVAVGIAVFAALLGWLLMLAGLVAWIAAVGEWPWYFVSMAAAGIHLAIAAALVAYAKSNSAPAFPHTRAEFMKDRQWLESLKTPKSSS